MQKNERLLDEHEAAGILGWSVSTMRGRRWKMQPPVYLKIGRNVRYRLSDLQDFINNNAVTPRHTVSPEDVE